MRTNTTETKTSRSAKTSGLTNVLRTTTLALPLVFAAAGTITVTSAMMAPSEAQAFGLGDITGAAKKVGGAVKNGAKKVGSVAKKGAKVVGKGGEAVGKVGLKAGKVAVGTAQAVRDQAARTAFQISGKPALLITEGIYRATGKWNEEERQRLRQLEKDGADWIEKQVRKMDRIPGKAARGVNHLIRNRGGVVIGESLPVPSQEAKRKMEEGLLNHARGGGLNRRMTTGIVKGKPIGNTMVDLGYGKNTKPIGRDKSVWGRPVGNVKLGVVKDESFRRPMGITKENLGLKNKRPIARDKSVWGRPVGNVKLGVVKDKSFRRPMGITKENLGLKGRKKLNRKAKFENKKHLQQRHNNKMRSDKRARRFDHKERNKFKTNRRAFKMDKRSRKMKFGNRNNQNKFAQNFDKKRDKRSRNR